MAAIRLREGRKWRFYNEVENLRRFEKHRRLRRNSSIGKEVKRRGKRKARRRLRKVRVKKEKKPVNLAEIWSEGEKKEYTSVYS